MVLAVCQGEMAAPASEVPTEPDLNLVTLDTLARFHGASRLPLATAMYLGANIARAVAEFHDRGEVLGTLDANRIRCSHDGRVVIVADGGSFMAPETKRGEPPDILSDIYAVGAIAYRLLTGMTPLQAMTRQPVSRLHQVPPPSSLIPGIDPALDEVLLSALATDPGERPITARVLSSTIEGVFAELELIASPSGVVRAVKATDSRRMKPRSESWTAEYTRGAEAKKPLGGERTETNSTVSTEVREVDAPTIDLQSIIVSPSLCVPAVRESSTVQTMPGSALAEPTRELLPEVQHLTVLERPSRVGRHAEETPTQSLPAPPQTALIYGHPFFRRDSAEVDAVSGEAAVGEGALEETLVRMRKKARFAGAVVQDARQRLGRKWRFASPGARRFSLAAVVGASAVLLFSLVGSARRGDASVEVGDTEVSVAGKPVARAAPVPAPVAAPAPAPVAASPVSPAKAAPVAPARPAVKTKAGGKLTKAKKSKLSKKALAKKKKAAAKRALARRNAR
jgi:hypothetical protein